MERGSKKQEHIRLYVANQILSGWYPVGTPIPSIRALARKFKVGISAVQHALKPLLDDGVIASRPQRGIYVQRRFPEYYPNRRYSVMVFLKAAMRSNSLIYQALLGVLESAAATDVSLNIHSLGREVIQSAELRREVGDAHGVLFLHSFDRCHLPHLPLDCPVAGLLAQNLFGGTISAVNLDLGVMAEQAGEYFRTRGIRHVEIFSAPDDPYIARGEHFLAGWRQTGNTAQLHVGEPGGVWSPNPEVGYFFTSDGWAEIAWERCRQELGEELTARHVLLGVDGKKLLDPDFPVFPTICCDYRNWGRILFAELLRRLECPQIEPRNVNVYGKIM